MNLKKTRIIAVIGTFIISFACHFLYNLFPSFITAVISPVNESIWEHMKILYTSIILYGIIDYFLFKEYYHNFFLNLALTSISSIIIYLLIFLPIYYSIGENMFISISLMLIVYIITYIISYYILSTKEKDNNIIWISIIIIGYIVFAYLTYKPIKHQIFFDTQKEIYGIPKKRT